MYINYLGEDDGIHTYYNNLQSDNKSKNIAERKNRLKNSSMTMSQRYTEITDLRYSHTLYGSFCNEKHRTKITRWRLSCHSLRIETGRYKKPPIPREERYCLFCRTVVEDEVHSLFHCDAHVFIRLRNKELLEKCNTLYKMLNPESESEVNMIGSYIEEIEKNMLSLKMIDK